MNSELAIHTGQDDASNPLRVHLTVKDANVVLRRVELFNEVGTVFGSVDCVRFRTLHWDSQPSLTRRPSADGRALEPWHNRSAGLGSIFGCTCSSMEMRRNCTGRWLFT